MDQTKTLIVTTGSTGAPLFASPTTADSIAAAIEALESSETWGEFLAALPPDLAQEVRDEFEDGTLPGADDEFDPAAVPGFESGDFPAWINATMLDEVPAPVITRFGTVSDSVLNGPMVEFRAEDLPAILSALRDMGYAVVERPELVLEVS